MRHANTCYQDNRDTVPSQTGSGRLLPTGRAVKVNPPFGTTPPPGMGATLASTDRTLHCHVIASGKARPQTRLGALPPVDLHEALGLQEQSEASSSSLLLATLGTCLVDRIRANAAIGNISIVNLVLEIEADLAFSPLWGSQGQNPAPAGFEAIQVKVHLDANAPDAALEALVKHAMLWSPVANTLHAPIHLDVTLVPRAAA